MLNSMRDKNMHGTYRGGRTDDACGHGLYRRSLTVKTSYEL